MTRWVEVPVPYVAERFIAITVPDGERFFAVSYEGVHEIVFGPPLEVRSDFAHPEGEGVYAGDVLTVAGRDWPAAGLYGGSGLLVDDRGYRLELEPPEPAETSDDGWVHVMRAGGGCVHSLPFQDFSGGWQQATFSTDFRHVVIGTPYTITIYRREESGPEAWEANG